MTIRNVTNTTSGGPDTTSSCANIVDPKEKRGNGIGNDMR
uniref:Uncharacterized protein n=1 Tax=Arundo donax TaxID=35708 RepID=A0A0A9BGE8_ARUDO